MNVDALLYIKPVRYSFNHFCGVSLFEQIKTMRFGFRKQQFTHLSSYEQLLVRFYNVMRARFHLQSLKCVAASYQTVSECKVIANYYKYWILLIMNYLKSDLFLLIDVIPNRRLHLH